MEFPNFVQHNVHTGMHAESGSHFYFTPFTAMNPPDARSPALPPPSQALHQIPWGGRQALSS